MALDHFPSKQFGTFVAAPGRGHFVVRSKCDYKVNKKSPQADNLLQLPSLVARLLREYRAAAGG